MDNLSDVVTREQVEIERQFAGAVFIGGTNFARQQVGWLDPETIMSPDIRDWWTRVRAGEDATEVAFSMNIAPDLLKWSNRITSSLNLEHYANALQEKNYIRVGLSSAEGMAKSADKGDIMQMRAFAETFLRRTDWGGTSGMRQPLEVADSLSRRIEKGNISVPWGIESLDDATMGLERGTLTVLAARPSMGKSSLAFQCNEKQALVQGLRVGVWALEMSAEQMFARRTCHKIGKAWMDVRSGHITPAEESELKKYVREYAEQLDGLMHINDDTSTTVSDIVRIQQREKFDVLMIDHLGLLKDRKFSGERTDQYLGRLTEQLHSLAKDTHSVVLLLAQLNRGVEQRTDKRPHMGDLRDSGNIEQNADNVALLYGDWYYDKTAQPYTEVIMGKFRDGVKDRSAFVEFDMRMQEFRSVDMENIDALATQQMEMVHETEGGYVQTNLQEEIPF